MVTGLPVKPMWFVERVLVPIEEQYKYLSDEDTDSDDEWTEKCPKKKKKKKKDKDCIAVSTDKRTKVTNPTQFMKKIRKEKARQKLMVSCPLRSIKGHHSEATPTETDCWILPHSVSFVWICLDLAGFGWIWLDSDGFGWI